MNGRLSGDSGHTSDEIGALEEEEGVAGGKLGDSPTSNLSQSQSPVTSSRLGGKSLVLCAGNFRHKKKDDKFMQM